MTRNLSPEKTPMDQEADLSALSLDDLVLLEDQTEAQLVRVREEINARAKHAAMCRWCLVAHGQHQEPCHTDCGCHEGGQPFMKKSYAERVAIMTRKAFRWSYDGGKTWHE